MHCEQFERRLNQLLDQRRNPAQDATLDRHACQCPRCQRLLEDQQIILAAVHWRRQTPQVSRTAVRHPALSHAPHPEKTTPWLMAMIAICLAVVLASGWLATVPRPQQLANNPVPVADTGHPREPIPWVTARATSSQPEGNGAIRPTPQPPLDSQSEPWPQLAESRSATHPARGGSLGVDQKPVARSRAPGGPEH